MIRRKIWTTNQVAELVGLHKETILAYLKCGKLKGTRIPRGLNGEGSPGSAGRYEYRISGQEVYDFVRRHLLPTTYPVSGDGLYSILVLSSGSEPTWLQEVHDALPEHRWVLADNPWDAGRFFEQFAPDLVILESPSESMLLRVDGAATNVIKLDGLCDRGLLIEEIKKELKSIQEVEETC